MFYFPYFNFSNHKKGKQHRFHLSQSVKSKPSQPVKGKEKVRLNHQLLVFFWVPKKKEG
jgi:hypothetical protein